MPIPLTSMTLTLNEDKFSFKPISKLYIEKEVQPINSKKTSTSDSISPKILKISSEVSGDTLQKLFNNMLKTGNFPDNLKIDITPVFQKKNVLHKASVYRPVSVLPSTSKVFEKLMQKQISDYISNYLSPYLCEYRKGFTLQQALLSLIENWRKILNKKGFVRAVLMDLSKAFDTMIFSEPKFVHMLSIKSY